MATLFERIAARLAYWHANRVYGRFLDALRNVDAVQNRVLQDVLSRMAGSDYSRRHGLGSVRSPEDLKRAAPLVTYEDLRPYIDRVCAGETAALFSSGERLQMFATSSGTTALRKLIPVTTEFVRQYRRGWNTFGLKLLRDHPRAVLRAILQSSGRHDESHTASGVPCGAITGLLAHSQKRVVRRFYVGTPEIALVGDPHAKYYTLMRFAVVRDVAFAITANPATLIRMAQTADQESERLVRDVRDGTLSSELVPDAALRRRLELRLRPAPQRARELARLRSADDVLRPRDYWRLEFLACWTAGSMGHYLKRLAGWWGPLPVRDVGLLASEGRVSIPLEDDTPAGVLDTQAAFFEFIPRDQWNRPNAETLTARELESGRDYVVVLTNTAGLVRYRLDDVVRVRGWVEQAPLIEFLHRAGRVASVAGEKLTENQVVEAVRAATTRLGLAEFDFVVAPHWHDPPFYQLNCPRPATTALAEAIDHALGEQNEEYSSRRKSLRLGILQVREVGLEAISS
ncbi:MAG: GH3 auxin-responsive promoter family protein, partial [Phycisphaerae bacterium]